MILPISSNLSDKSAVFYGDNVVNKITSENEQVKEKKPLKYNTDTLLDNSISNRARISLHKILNGFFIYPIQGLMGSVNSNFYEFLTMGTVPYVIGSGTLIAIFNAMNKSFASHKDTLKASQIGRKMGLGVIFYAIMRSLSKSFIDLPVKWITGIDTQRPYVRVNKKLQERPDKTNDPSFEYHKIGESVDFTRWDLLYKDARTENRNELYDKIAKRNGLGTNLNDSDQEVKPIYREVLIKSSIARTFSSYLWAAVGVALAFQEPWDDYFKVATLKFWQPEKFGHSLKIFGESFVESAKALYKGNPDPFASKIEKYAGKGLIGLAAAVSVLGLLNTLHITKKPSKVKASDVMDKNKESVVC